jgi:molybdopterin-guanine dinucleotide biosynthesis protein B
VKGELRVRVFAVTGFSQSGKTTTLEKLITELGNRGYTVGSVKEIHDRNFTLDAAGTNTDRHKKAGSQPVVARGLSETGVFWPERLEVPRILEFFNHDFVALEGVTDFAAPVILCARTVKDIDKQLCSRVFAVSGVVAGQLTTYAGLPVISALNDPAGLADLVEKMAAPAKIISEANDGWRSP